jgi:predicted phage baseplate assembly protein
LALQRRELPYLFGSQPAPGISVYFGLSATPDSGTLSLGFLWSGSRIDEWERRRILGEASSATIPLHHSVRVQWEASVVAPGGYRWAAIVADDNTRSMTLNGTVQLPIPSGGTSIVLGREPARFYVRCRLLAGQFDRPPRLSQVFLNAVEGEQAIPARQAGSLPIASDPESPVLPDPSVVLGVANGQPSQQLRMTGAPVVAESVALYSLETTAAGTAWRKWDARVDLIASGPADAHFVLDASRGTISFGDAHHGRVAPVGAVFAAAYETTRGAGGQTGAGVVSTIVDPSLAATAYIANPGAAEGGADAETLAQAMGRAIELREAVWRAMTAKDIRTIALEAPGTLVGRAEVKLNSYPGLNCVQAHGVISVFIMPDAPGKRPQPSAGLLRVLAARLNNRRIVGTRFIVLGPDYVTVTVQASVKQVAYADRSQVAANVKAALNAFFDPLTGGPDGAGWPFGRGVYRSEVLQVMDQTAGVDYVRSLDLVADTCAPRCGNLCLGPTMLVATGDHEIEVV